MDIVKLSSKELKEKDTAELFKIFDSKKEGLSSNEAKKRLDEFGLNEIEEKKKSILLVFLNYFWGPIPWMIEIACILSLILKHLADFYIILALLLINCLVDFFEEYQAGNAIAALQKKLAHKCLVLRDEKWIEIDAKELVIGDVIKLLIGDIIPADAKVFEGKYLSVDQSALTGESLPKTKKISDIVYSGSVVKQGEMQALVVAIGKNTFFGQTTKLVEKAKSISHFQKAIIQIGDYLIYISLSLAILLIIIQLIKSNPFLELIQFVLILVVASIPVAMPAVLSVTMALGALKLSKMKAVVTKLESIEEMAGVDVLCCDKTGTLTQNKLQLIESEVFSDIDKQKVILYAALASKKEGKDFIDIAVIDALKNQEELKKYTQSDFTPFDPVNKKTQATIKFNNNLFYVTKGAPQVILKLCKKDSNYEKKINDKIDEFAKKGYRTLGVAYSDDNKNWKFQGLLPLSDPLREDSKEMIEQAKSYGIKVKMLTGDNLAIANEVASELGLLGDIFIAKDIIPEGSKQINEQLIEKSSGFAQIFPEHKYEIVNVLQKNNHIVGMTGDGVNDSPALKQADVGIAVDGATDAAKGASALVLLKSGLSVIIKGIQEARRIFERMNSYAIYRIAETIRIMFFVFFSITIFNTYPVTAIMIVLLALLNDIPIMSIVTDNASLSQLPVKWEMGRITSLATLLGLIGVVASFSLLVIGKEYFHLPLEQIQSLIFLKLSISGHLTLFIARTKSNFFHKPYPSLILFFAILTTQIIAALIVGFGIFVHALAWKYIGFVWLYAIVWFFITDFAKIIFYKHVNFESQHHKRFLKTIKKKIFNHGKASVE